ncbi:MAG TPA: DUF488 domain-containing protein [Thermoguttaceae bacterium]|nr:DUF488 domain-containing protein [Thermoguttaceae bacterium]
MTDWTGEPGATIWTVGHSNHPLEHFLDLLAGQEIAVLVDVRSSPYSGYATHFNKEALQDPLQDRGVKYLFLGDLLGGRVDDEQFCDEEGRVLYGRLAESPGFRQGIERLIQGTANYRVALMCGEEDPTHCHRRLLVGRVLRGRGVAVLHIRGDGSVRSEEQLAAEEEFQKTRGQMTLFDMEEPDEWKSTRSVLPRNPPGSSSESSAERESGG